MKRIILHWSAGTHTPNGLDKRHYHFLIDGDGNVVRGNNPPEANEVIRQPTNGDTYAPHTRGANTGSIGIALAAMRGAKEVPFSPGSHPIKPVQVDAMVRLAADQAQFYGIPITETTVLTHAEVGPRLGIKQRAKWDIAWLPGMDRPGDPLAIGDDLRSRIGAAQKPVTASQVEHWLARLIRAIFGSKGGRS